MTTNPDYLDTWLTYQAAWSDISPDERRRLLERSVADDCVYSDPVSQCRGRKDLTARIEESKVQFPGASFRNNNLIDHHAQALSNWTMLDGNGAEAVTGISYAQFGPDGRLTQMTGFF